MVRNMWVGTEFLDGIVIVFERRDDTHLFFLEFVDLEIGAAEFVVELWIFGIW